ncbi:MAG: Rrf2 family transcriptional regulator [Bacteroidetes bacterium]|nr:Rrf2 family transcriptional regulator [Bacteroidota bacterium]
MSIIFSRACEYGIQATLYIATQPDRRVGIKEIASELSIPVHFLAKILQSLSEKGVLSSFKGVHGGFTLQRAPGSIHLIDVVEAIDGLDFFDSCVLGFPGCGTGKPCPVHDRWGKVRTTIREMLSTDSLLDLLPSSKEKITDVVEEYARRH